ncbi:N-acetyltransferase [Candidatus Neomarinimicrobiota bacterium]
MEVQQVDSPALLRRFIDLPYNLYRNVSCWIPPLRADVAAQLSARNNPFFRHASHALFLATDKGMDLGRMAVFYNFKHNRVHETNIGMFGFLDVIDDVAITSRLMAAASAWLGPYHVTALRGPFNPDINAPAGILMDAYDQPPMVFMTYNHPYYPLHLESLGFRMIRDLYAYDVTAQKSLLERYKEIANTQEERGRFTIRTPNMRRFWQEVEKLKCIYNEAWSDNWGALPLDDEEFAHLAKNLRRIIDPDLVYIAEVNGQPAGFALTIPNINEALAHLPDGRLFPFGWIKLLWHKRNVKTLRVFAMGVLKPYRHLGIDAAFYWRTFETGLAKGYRHGEMSWIVEDNIPMICVMEKVGARRYKTYRIYERHVSQQ